MWKSRQHPRLRLSQHTSSPMCLQCLCVQEIPAREWHATAGKFVFAGRFLTPRLLFHSQVLGKSLGPEILSHLSGQCWHFLTFADHSSVRGIGRGGTLGETMINWCFASCLLRDVVSLSLLFASCTCEFSKKQLFVQADIVLWVDQARGINHLC